jgi:ABC-type glycerol-3-phosphate transport system substrate-binding protein
MFGDRLTGRLGAILLAATLLGACGASATASPTTPTQTPSPMANPDAALVADLRPWSAIPTTRPGSRRSMRRTRWSAN